MKIVLIGGEAVGKTSIVNYYIGRDPNIPLTSTIQLAFSKKHVVIGKDTNSLQICDTAGQERFQSIGRAFYRGANAAFVVYDVTSMPSFRRMRHWIDELGATMPNSFILCIVANKIDRVDDRKISREDGLKVAQENNAIYQETSARTGHGVKAAFQMVCEKHIENTREQDPMVVLDVHPIQLDQSTVRVDKDGCC
jgi:small GTP-binding protein